MIHFQFPLLITNKFPFTFRYISLSYNTTILIHCSYRLSNTANQYTRTQLASKYLRKQPNPKCIGATQPDHDSRCQYIRQELLIRAKSVSTNILFIWFHCCNPNTTHDLYSGWYNFFLKEKPINSR